MSNVQLAEFTKEKLMQAIQSGTQADKDFACRAVSRLIDIISARPVVIQQNNGAVERR